MDSNKPKISVVIPTHNRPDRVKNAIQSVVNQSFNDLEIIVVDDGIEKRAERAVKQLNDNRIIYIKNEVNIGGGATRNVGIKNARAGLIAFLDDDDEWYKDKLSEQYAVMKKHWGEIGFVFCCIELHYEGSNRVTIQELKQTGINDLYDDLLAHRLRTLTSSLLIKKEVLAFVDGFDVEFESCQEWDMMIRISEHYKGYGMSDVLVKMNFLLGDHIGGNLERRILGRGRLINKHLLTLSKKPHVLAAHYFQLGLFCRDNGDIKKARSIFAKAIKSEPSSMLYWKHFFVLLFGEGFYKFIKKFT